MKMLLALMGLLFISGCQATDPLSGERDPHPLWWSIDFQGPSYMIGEVEERIVEDVNGKFFQRPGGGTIGTDSPEDGTESARGWGNIISNVMPVTGAAMPKRIFVRWQSVVEPQTYKVWVDLPDEARQLLQSSTSRRCQARPDSPARVGASLIMGLAPGGVVVVWVKDSCHKPVEVARAQAEVEPLGPSQGKTEGRYAHKINAKTQRYIERYGIPYSSW